MGYAPHSIANNSQPGSLHGANSPNSPEIHRLLSDQSPQLSLCRLTLVDNAVSQLSLGAAALCRDNFFSTFKLLPAHAGLHNRESFVLTPSRQNLWRMPTMNISWLAVPS
jgi:hypothetical protein